MESIMRLFQFRHIQFLKHILMGLLFTMVAGSYLHAQTNVSGIISSNTRWTASGSPYNLSGTVQIAYGVRLSIDPGVVVLGNGRNIEVFGTLNVAGSSASPVIFENTHIVPGRNSPAEPFFMNIEYAQITGGSLHTAGSAGYGYLVLRNSTLTRIPYMYLWYPTSDCYIERNIFINSGGISVGTRARFVYIRNNVFYQQTATYGAIYAVENWASYDQGNTIVQHNSFLSTDRVAVRLKPGGYNTAAMIATENYWGTTDLSVVASMIYDKNDDLSCAGYISYLPILTSPHPNTPHFSLDVTVPVISKLDPSSMASGSSAFWLSVHGSGFKNTSYITWNGSPRSTTYVSATELKTYISADDVASCRAVSISVVTPEAGTSKSVTFNVLHQLTFPQLAIGGGYRTILLITNASTNFNDVTLQPRQGNNQFWNGSFFINGRDYTGLDKFTTRLNPMTTMKFILEGDRTLRTGYLRTISDLRQIAVSFFYEFYSDGILTNSTGVPVSELSTKFMFPVESSERINTGFAVSPPANFTSTDVLFTLRDGHGSVVQQRRVTVTGYFAMFFNELFKNVPRDFIGSVSMEANEKLHLVVLRMEYVPAAAFLLTSVPPESDIP